MFLAMIFPSPVGSMASGDNACAMSTPPPRPPRLTGCPNWLAKSGMDGCGGIVSEDVTDGAKKLGYGTGMAPTGGDLRPGVEEATGGVSDDEDVEAALLLPPEGGGGPNGGGVGECDVGDLDLRLRSACLLRVGDGVRPAAARSSLPTATAAPLMSRWLIHTGRAHNHSRSLRVWHCAASASHGNGHFAEGKKALTRFEVPLLA
jgi:hypothetical protein